MLAVIESQRLVSDGYHLASPDPSGDGMTRAVELALEDAELEPRDIGAVIVSAVGSPFHERLLGRVLARSLRGAARSVPITSHELSVGHVLAASSPIAIAYAAAVLSSRRVDRAFPWDALEHGISRETSTTARLERDHVLALSVGFGGFNGVTIVGSAS